MYCRAKLSAFWIEKQITRTFEVLGRENNGSKVVVLDQALDLRSYFSAIPAHDQHLANRPVPNHIEKTKRQRLPRLRRMQQMLSRSTQQRT